MEGLLRLARVHGVSDHALVRRMLALLVASASGATRSRLTRSGRGLEASVVSARVPTRALRYAVDAVGAGRPVQRLEAAGALTETALEILGSADGIIAHRSIQSRLMNPHAGHRAFADFTVWHGMIHVPSGEWVFKTYYNLRPWKSDSDRLLASLESIPGLGPMSRIWAIDRLPLAWPGFLGVEYDRDGVRASKLYWQRQIPFFASELRERGSTIFPESRVVALDTLNDVLFDGRGRYPHASTILSSKVSARSDRTELGFHFHVPSLVSKDASTHRRIRKLIEALGLDGGAYRASYQELCGPARDNHRIHSVLALSLDPDSARVTVYFDPPALA